MFELFEFLDGKEYTHEGVHGYLRYRKWITNYPYPRIDHELYHRASDVGRKSPEYLKMKTQLKDDWDTDLSNDHELLARLAGKFGFSVEYEEGQNAE